VAAPFASALIGPGARRLMELESLTKRRFFLTGKPDMHSDHFVVLGEGKLADLAPAAPVEEGAELMLELGEVDRHDGSAAVGKVDGFDVCVGDAASLVGKRVKVKVERVFGGVAYATLVRKAGKKAVEPLTAEAEAEKPTRKPPARKPDAEAAGDEEPGESEPAEEAELEEVAELEIESGAAEETLAEDEEPAADGAAAAKKKTRRGTRGGRNRKKPATAATAAAEDESGTETAAGEAKKSVTIHVPPADLGEEATAVSENGDAPAGAPAKKKTRRGSRGGKNRRKREATGAAEANGSEPESATKAPEAVGPAEEPTEENWDYVPMSQWGDEIDQ